MLEKMYEKFGINNRTDFSRLRPVDYPILSDLYKIIEETYENYDAEKNPLYPRELVQEVLLGLQPGEICAVVDAEFLIHLLQHQLDGVDVAVREIFISAEKVLQEGDVLAQPGVLPKGAESKFFNGPTNITSSRFLVFGVKGLLQASGSAL